MESSYYNSTMALVSSNVTLQEEENTEEDGDVLTYKDFLTYDIGRNITRYWFPIWGPIGVIGNIISLCVMLLPANRKLIVSMYLAVIAVNDTIIIVFINSYIWQHDFFHSPWGNYECKIFMYFVSVFTQAATLILILMTYDKFYVFRNPLKSSTHNNMKRLKIGIVLIYLLVAIVNILKFPSSRSLGLVCYSSDVSTWYLQAFLYYRIVVVYAAPLAGIFLMNMYILYKVRESHKEMNKFVEPVKSGTQNGESKKNDATGNDVIKREAKKPRDRARQEAEAHLTRMLLLITSSFVVFTTPSFCRYLYLAYIDSPTSPRGKATSYLLSVLFRSLFYMNFQTNFFLYSLSGSRFRRDIVMIFKRIIGIKEEKNVGENNTSVSTLSNSV